VTETKWDVIVAGAGAGGSAALYQLARRGVKALGLDRWHPPHTHGSSHGDTRITRLALGEGEEYVPFARRSHEIWRELEAATGRTLLRQIGGLVFGPRSGRTRAHGAVDFLGTTLAVAQRTGLSHEVLEAAALQARFPQFHWRGDEWGCLEHGAGFVYPEACISAQLERAQQLGAVLHTGEPVVSWEVSGSAVRVVTAGAVYETSGLILGAGAWLPGLAGLPASRARVYRQVLHWFEPEGRHTVFTPEQMPVFIRVPDDGSEMFYGFPAIDGPGGGLKIAGEQFCTTTDPDGMDAAVSSDEVRAMYALASPHLRISPQWVRSVACKYTVTPDFGFIVDRHPESERVCFASACSGHGFKHSAAVGEALAEMAITGGSRYDLSRFRLNRFAAPQLS
jgi:sarcosine oxidase